ncbi:MAG: SHOCT domain-containing protein [Nitrosopumilus sp.]|nr:SHOCT domain-containing protein [Nitrosopumilus sp.]MDH3853269.1 SHOCT domain-containing protein [Nitrosopumilus sp.]
MANKKEKSDDFRKTLKKKQEHILKDVTKNYAQTVEHGKQLGKESLEKINQVTNNTADFLKSQEYLKTLKVNSLKIREKGLEQKSMLKKKSPKFYKKIINGFFYFFELIVGRIKLGTQYGTSSLEILEKLAKLKELGIITDKEFNDKKKKILDRI